MKYDKVYLRKRPQYDEMIDEIELKQPKIKYPNRNAQFLRNSPYLSQFDGDQSFINMEEQENNIAKQRIMEETMRQMARDKGYTHSFFRAATSEPRQTEFFDMASDDGNSVDSYSDINSEAERRAAAEMSKQKQYADLFSKAPHKDDLEETMQDRIAAEKREASQEATPAREKKTSKEKHTWHKGYRSRSPLRADPEETEKIRQRLRRKTSKPPTDTLPPVPPPATPPPTSTKTNSPPKYPSLNQKAAKEKVGGSIRIKPRGPTGAAAAAADEYEEEDEEATAGVYNIRPSLMGVQVLREILETASNKRRLSWDDENRYTRAINKWTAAVKAKDKLSKEKAIAEMRELYKKNFYKKKLL